jgi:hypothetical protein
MRNTVSNEDASGLPGGASRLPSNKTPNDLSLAFPSPFPPLAGSVTERPCPKLGGYSRQRA